MSQLSKILAFAGLCLLITACSQTLQRQTCVELAADVNYCLAPVSQQDLTDNKQAISATQKVSIETTDNQHELLSQLEITGQQLTLVGLAPLGQALFTLTYDGNTLISEQSQLLGDQFKAEYLLAIMQLIYWPDTSVNRHLQGAKVQSYPCDATLCRGLFFANNNAKNGTIDSAADEQPIITIRYNRLDDSNLSESSLNKSNLDKWQADVNLNIPAANFKLSISPL
ncbi:MULTISPECIES: DUF3261 domain-containing protein [unclassified Shewanella]|uniref:DUF3261 domain-containing protein n=1 Tax=unclassified Shewanella TaxID=196818 RepID=UPI001BC75C3B|nr:MULTISPECIES: DUF3261 domain-containing protein [unclassified Shewanella]GIU11342.1 hypothetical protein TUM4444_17090 [Shewanella sp. MBTL60-112-B1]GIU31050.1 hypothetical protein TUM4445_15070 [Shewanella sp. MBTL60-112-B2]